MTTSALQRVINQGRAPRGKRAPVSAPKEGDSQSDDDDGPPTPGPRPAPPSPPHWTPVRDDDRSPPGRRDRSQASGKVDTSDDANIESNVGVVGLGGTGVRITSGIFAADATAPGIGQSFGFDLDADEQVAGQGRGYVYTLVRQTGGIPAAGVFSFSEMLSDKLLSADIADLDASAARYQATIRRAVEASLYNVTMPVFSAGGGVGHGLFRSIHKAIPRGRTLGVPIMVFPGPRQPLPIRVSAAAAVGRFFRDDGPLLSLVVDNAHLGRQRTARSRGPYQNTPVTDALRISGAAIDLAFARQEADGNIDRALLTLTRGPSHRLGTLGTASRMAKGDGTASLVAAVRDALAQPLAQLGPGRRRALVFAVVPDWLDTGSAQGILESARLGPPGGPAMDLAGAFLGRTSSYTCDVAVWIAGNPRPTFLDNELGGDPEDLELEVTHKVATGQSKLDRACQHPKLKPLLANTDVGSYLDDAAKDMRRGIQYLDNGGHA